MKPTVYIETTIVSYLTAWPSQDVVRLSHQIITRKWWEKSRDSYDLFISAFVTQEASDGDRVAAAERLKAMEGIPLLPLLPQADALAKRIVDALHLPAQARIDAFHAAIAAVHSIDYLLTWNCRHLANAKQAAKIEQACREAGYVARRGY